MAPKSKYLPLNCLSWAHAIRPPNSTEQVLGPWDTDNKWWERSTLVMPLCRQEGSQLGSQTSSTSQELRPGFALQCYFEHKKPPTFKHHCLHSHFSRKMLAIILPYQYQLCICVCFCTACALEMCFGFSSNPLQCPQRDLHCYKACWDCFQFIHNCF